MDKPFLEKVVFSFNQEGNADGTTSLPGTDGWETLTIEIQSCLNSLREKPGYLVLRTPTGWSINDPEELTELLNYVQDIL